MRQEYDLQDDFLLLQQEYDVLQDEFLRRDVEVHEYGDDFKSRVVEELESCDSLAAIENSIQWFRDHSEEVQGVLPLQVHGSLCLDVYEVASLKDWIKKYRKGRVPLGDMRHVLVEPVLALKEALRIKNEIKEETKE